jgi:altronate dehydratase
VTRLERPDRRIGLVVPTSLCSGQIAGLIVERLRQRQAGSGMRFLALPHTEGCGVSGDEAIEILERTLVNYACHPAVKAALFLEHGCEKTHNDAMRDYLRQRGLTADRFGWASIQLDGGIESVSQRVERWFDSCSAAGPQEAPAEPSSGAPWLGIVCPGGDAPAVMVEAFARIARTVLSLGGTVVVSEPPEGCCERSLPERLTEAGRIQPTLAYGEFAARTGLHVMETPTDNPLEILTGLGATGVDLILAWTAGGGGQGHALLPVLQVAPLRPKASEGAAGWGPGDADLSFDPATADAPGLAARVLSLVARTLAGDYAPRARVLGNEGFQITRGWLGVST